MFNLSIPVYIRFVFGFVFMLACTETQQPKKEVTVIAGGDVVWCRDVKAPGIYFGTKNDSKLYREDKWRRLPFIATDQSIKHIEEKFEKKLIDSTSHHINSILYPLSFDNKDDEAIYPFKKIAATLKIADLAFVNLETPLSDFARNSGSFRTPTHFAKGLLYAGVDVISTANNHAFDCEGEGIRDTYTTLKKAGLASIGTGENLQEARKPFIFIKNGIKLAFFAYTYGVNPTITPLGFALPDQSGAVPLDPFLMKADIQSVRDKVDFVLLSFHWGLENKREIHPAAREFAHEILDAGADAIIGHHPHVPRGIEIYKGKPIIYSLGNLIFGHNHTYWGDNLLVKMTLTPEGITRLEVIPVAGEGEDVTQPYVLTGTRADTLLKDIQNRSLELNTKMEIEGETGFITIHSAEESQVGSN